MSGVHRNGPDRYKKPWARQIQPEELEEIRRRGHGVVAARVDAPAEIDGVIVLPAALVLLRLAALSAPTRS